MNDVEKTADGMWKCPKCESEWSSAVAAIACLEDDIDRHNVRGYD